MFLCSSTRLDIYSIFSLQWVLDFSKKNQIRVLNFFGSSKARDNVCVKFLDFPWQSQKIRVSSNELQDSWVSSPNQSSVIRLKEAIKKPRYFLANTGRVNHLNSLEFCNDEKTKLDFFRALMSCALNILINS